jgi:hypothetical protein
MAAVPPGLATAVQDGYRLDRELGHDDMKTSSITAGSLSRS